MWYRRENGVLTGGPFSCEQAFPVEYLEESVPEVLAFHAQASAILTAFQAKATVDQRLAALEFKVFGTATASSP